MAEHYDYLIVGAGFAGAVLAERLANDAGRSCLVIDQRAHLAGNAHDYTDRAGVLVHGYGPHYFRTNSKRILDYLSRFTDWIPAEYKILVETRGRLWSFPVNLQTFEQYLGRPSTSEEMEATLAKWRLPIERPANSEEVILSQIGRPFYEMFFEGYTLKQWKRHPRELDPEVCARIPLRTDRNDRYLSEKYQVMPAQGYTRIFEKMLAHPKIEVRLRTSFQEIRPHISWSHLIYTGPIDAYFDHCHGPLPYRSLDFEFETVERETYQPVVQVNYPNDHEFTRIVEIKHVTGQKIPVTTIVREYPREPGPGREPYYPIPAADAKAVYAKYAALAKQEKGVSFVGRLATYRYYNMDQVVGMALSEYDRLYPNNPGSGAR